MKIFVKYISWVYLKYFFIIFVALEFFYISIDTLTNLKDFPKSANLQLIYISLTALTAINYILPLSLIFALIITKINMIRNNELISFYALGIHKNSLILPPFFIALFIVILYIFASATPFAYARDYQKNLINFQAMYKIQSKGIFLKYEDKFIYIKTLNANLGVANDVTIFSLTKDRKIASQIEAKTAEFRENSWVLNDATITTLPENLELGESGYTKISHQKVLTLSGFKPKTIDNLYKSSDSYSILDGINSIITLKNENINLNKIKSNLYSLIFFPLFAPLMVMIIYYYLPLSGRFFNLALASFTYLIVTLCIWGVLFVMIKFSSNGVIMPELGIIAPIVLIGLFAFRKFSQNI